MVRMELTPYASGRRALSPVFPRVFRYYWAGNIWPGSGAIMVKLSVPEKLL